MFSFQQIWGQTCNFVYFLYRSAWSVYMHRLAGEMEKATPVTDHPLTVFWDITWHIYILFKATKYEKTWTERYIVTLLEWITKYLSFDYIIILSFYHPGMISAKSQLKKILTFSVKDISIKLFYLYQRLQCRDKYFFKIRFVFFLYLWLSASSKENDLPLCIYFWYQTDSGVPNTSIYSAVSLASPYYNYL